MFENNLIAGVSGQGGGYNIENSLRFNDNDSAYLSRTPATAGNRKTWTWSGWVKRGNIGTRQAPFTANSGTAGHTFEINSTDTLRIFDTGTGAAVFVETTPIFRDVSGWYHIVLVADTTQSTASNRIKFYVNGSLITDYVNTSYPSLNADLEINNNIAHNIGNRPLNTFYFDGYLAEINFIDGQALTPDNFGEIDATTGEWSPKKYSGTYGTNGFYLPFNGNANDSSGNGNNWTENNLASTDYMIDTPTNNFSVLQNSPIGSGVTYQEGNLEFSNAAFNSAQSGSTIRFSSGKWYCEVTTIAESVSGLGLFGIRNPVTADRWLYYGYSGFKYSTISGVSANSAYGATYGIGDVIGISYDADTGDLEFYKNNVSQGVIATGFSGQELEFWFADGSSDETLTGVLNFGADSSFAGNKTRQGNTDANGIGDFYYTPPTGYLALCTDNLPEPTIVDSESHFNVVTYTGTGTTLNVTGVGFQPDLVWMKRRDSANTHDLIDVVRGDTARLFPNLTDAELSDVTFSFDSDGFSPDPTKANENAAGGSYVAWCWKAGGTAVTNTNGTITSQVSANVDAGFSIVGYTGTGSTATVGHGLSQAPEIMIVKNRGDTRNWCVYAKPIADISVNNILFLDLTSAILSNSSVYGASPTPTVFTVQTNFAVNGPSNNHIAYCFHSVEGFSKFGSYVGNGSANGPFVYTGFKPAFVLYKRAVGGTGNWTLYDNEREGYNGDNPSLYPNLTNAESISGTSIDFLANGFKILNPNTDHNASGSTYIYIAFAEHPLNYSTGR